jgi:hypothetical protein
VEGNLVAHCGEDDLVYSALAGGGKRILADLEVKTKQEHSSNK